MNAADLHRQSIVIDTHCDTLLDVIAGKRSLLERSDQGQLDLPRLQEGGVTAQVFAIYLPDPYVYYAPTSRAFAMLDHLYQAVDKSEGQLALARTAADIEAAHAAGRVAAIVGLEGAEPLDGSLELFHIFHRLGLRVLGLTWNRRNQVADGLDFVRTGGGLTPFGAKLIEECNRLGVAIDISHLAPRGVQDVFDISQQPIIASHANAHALCDHPRNLSDAQLRTIAERGGVVGATFVPSFITKDPAQASIDKLLDHVDYMVKVMGIDHVAIGSDFDGIDSPPPGLKTVTELPNLTAALLARGYAVADVQKILGGNWLRVFRQIWE